ncbi:ATP-binding protein [Nanoarchaeota archaeon]
MPYDVIIGRNESDKVKFEKEGLLYLGKGYVKMGTTSSLSNPILMDVARSHVVLIAGKRGSGKSYTLGVIAEEMATLPKEISQNLSTLIFDTMGIFWTMTHANEKEQGLLKSWGLKPKKLPINVFVPLGFAEKYKEMGVYVTKGFAFKADELTADDWTLTFNVGMLNPVGIAIQRVIAKLQDKKRDYDLDNIIDEIKKDQEAAQEAKAAAVNLFEAAKTWGIFVKKGEKGTSVSELVEAGETSVLDLSTYSSTATFNVRALVIGLITKKLFLQRTLKRKKEEVEAVRHGLDYLRHREKREMPLVWLMIDELHEFLPEKGKTPATDALIQLIREGRQPGLSLVGATQQPGKVHTDIWTQSDIVIAHRLTARPDVEALSTIMQTYLTDDIQAYMNQLPDLKGSAIILDDNSERIYPMRMRARFTWHGGESPTSIKVKKRL